MNEIVFKVIYFQENKGLGNALREAMNHCSNELVARMDSDDISMNRRFELQLKKFIKNPYLDIVGGNITEFEAVPSNIRMERVVAKTDVDIKQDMKKRCAMNHMSVMYKKTVVQKAGGYQDWPWNEDYYLWIRMMENRATFENIPIALVNVRTGSDMSARRGGWKYFKSEQMLQKYMLDHKLISLPRYIYNIFIRFCGEVASPNWLRYRMFKLVRKSYKIQRKHLYIKNEIGKKQKNTNYPPFSVAMSIYNKDNAEWFDIALNSIINQTVRPSEIVLVVDGPVPKAIQEVIDKYIKICKCKEAVLCNR